MKETKKGIKEKLMKFSANQVVTYVTIIGEKVPISRDEALGLFGCKIPKKW